MNCQLATLNSEAIESQRNVDSWSGVATKGANSASTAMMVSTAAGNSRRKRLPQKPRRTIPSSGLPCANNRLAMRKPDRVKNVDTPR